MAPTPLTGDPVTKEYRVAVVMYGGISLAIYMNGIAQELLAMVRSTAAEDPDSNSYAMVSNLKGTEPVYRDLALLLSEENDGEVHTRFVIDIISGTSAGGINGVFLAKALARRKDLESLKRTWVEEGDFQKLLNDQELSDIDLRKQVPPRALLSGERMYVKLFEAFADMDQDPGPSYVRNLQLSVTATDLVGKLVPLRLADRVVWERRYKQAFHLRYSRDQKIDDFHPGNSPFLAFIARCTSSFPIAFEPMQLDAVPRLVKASIKYGSTFDLACKDCKQNFQAWQDFLGPQDDSRFPDAQRFFADGGYLDNHPFDHAIAGLARLSSTVRGERKLLYIEPSPEHPERGNQGLDKDGHLIQPNALENAWDGLAAIPGKQPIRDSLVQIQQRNRLIRKVTNVIGEMSDAVAVSPITAQSRRLAANPVPRGEAQPPRDPPTANRPGFQAYQALNVYAVTDDLATRIARLSGIPDDSDYVYAIRCLIKVWREEEYKDHEGQFLLDFDIAYRMRRYLFVISQLDMLGSLNVDAVKRLQKLNLTVSAAGKAEFRSELGALRAVLEAGFRRIQAASQSAATNQEIIGRIQELNIEAPDLNEILGVGRASGSQAFAPLPVIDNSAFEARAQTVLERVPERKKTLEALRTGILKHYGEAMTRARNDVSAALQDSGSNSPMREAALHLARLYFYGFQEFDAAIFPITYGTDAGELIPVDVVRVSPEDAIAIQDESKTTWPKLAGASFGAFGAFLEKVWRTNDILWGRLDGAERIIRALAGQTARADELIRRAHDAIILEELTPANRETICQMLLEAILRAGGDSAAADQTREQMIAAIEQCVRAETGSTDINPKLLALLRAALPVDSLRESLKTFKIGREPNRRNTLANVARSARIVGRILEDIGRTETALKKPGAILVQAGSVLWGLVEVATPGAIYGAFFTYWFGLLMLFALVMILGGTVFSQPMQSLGFRLLVLAFAARLSVSVLHAHILGDRKWKRRLEVLFILGLLALLTLGLYELEKIWTHFYTEDLAPAIAAVHDWVKKLMK